MRNVLAQLRRLFPEAPLLAGQVTAAAGGAVTVQLPDGSKVSARGAATVGQTVFVRDGVVEGAAPALSVVEIEV